VLVLAPDASRDCPEGDPLDACGIAMLPDEAPAFSIESDDDDACKGPPLKPATATGGNGGGGSRAGAGIALAVWGSAVPTGAGGSG